MTTDDRHPSSESEFRTDASGGASMATENGSSGADGGETVREQIHACVLGKAYIAVLKHQLAGAPAGKSLREVFDGAYREGIALAKVEPLESLGFARPKRPPS